MLRRQDRIEERLIAIENRSKPLDDIDDQIAALKRKKAEVKAAEARELKRKRVDEKAAEAAELKRKRVEEKAAARVAKNLERQANKKARKQPEESIAARLDNIDRMIDMYDLKEELDVKAEPKLLKVKGEPNHLEVIELD